MGSPRAPNQVDVFFGVSHSSHFEKITTIIRPRNIQKNLARSPNLLESMIFLRFLFISFRENRGEYEASKYLKKSRPGPKSLRVGDLFAFLIQLIFRNPPLKYTTSKYSKKSYPYSKSLRVGDLFAFLIYLIFPNPPLKYKTSKYSKKSYPGPKSIRAGDLFAFFVARGTTRR